MLMAVQDTGTTREWNKKSRATFDLVDRTPPGGLLQFNCDALMVAAVAVTTAAAAASAEVSTLMHHLALVETLIEALIEMLVVLVEVISGDLPLACRVTHLIAMSREVLRVLRERLPLLG